MLLHIITYGKLKNQNIQILKGLNLVFSKNKLIFFKKNFEIISMEQFLNEDYNKKKKYSINF